MKGQLEIMKSIGIKPNFSELERALGINRHTSGRSITNDFTFIDTSFNRESVIGQCID